MATWKKILILLGALFLAFGIGYGAATFISYSTTANLRARVEQLDRERNQALDAEQQAKERVSELTDNLRQSESRVDELTAGFNKLAETNRRFTEGFNKLENSITILSSGIRGVTDSVTESGGLIQESMGILLGVSKRDGKATK